MKKILCLVALLCGMSVMAFGQGTKNLSVEIGGVASGFGIRYDARIDGNAGLGYAAVLSYSQDGLFSWMILTSSATTICSLLKSTICSESRNITSRLAPVC